MTFQNYLYFSLLGYDASLELPEDMRTPLFMKDLQKFLLFALLGCDAPIEPLRWCKFEQWSKISHINFLAIDGLGVKDWTDLQSSKLKSILQTQLEFVSPLSYNSNLADDLAILPVSARKADKLKKEYGKLQKAFAKGEVFKVFRSLFKVVENVQKPQNTESDKLSLLLNLTQMLEEHYPLPLDGPMSQKYSNYVFSKDLYQEVHENSPLYAIDCEMCLTSIGKLELTKICVVDQNLKSVYSTLVKPKNYIVNYLTRFSGVTKELLEKVDITLEDVQERLREILSPDSVWIGQSLNSDLNAMKMFHPYVIDTSVIYNISGNPGRKTSLKNLSHMFLGESIQDGNGHDPEEDAKAAM